MIPGEILVDAVRLPTLRGEVRSARKSAEVIVGAIRRTKFRVRQFGAGETAK